MFGDLLLPFRVVDALAGLSRLQRLRVPRLPRLSQLTQTVSHTFPALRTLQLSSMRRPDPDALSVCGKTLESLSLYLTTEARLRQSFFRGLMCLKKLRLRGGTLEGTRPRGRPIFEGVEVVHLSSLEKLAWLKDSFGESLKSIVLHAVPSKTVADFLMAAPKGLQDLRIFLVNEEMLRESIVDAVLRQHESLQRIFLDGMFSCPLVLTVQHSYLHVTVKQ